MKHLSHYLKDDNISEFKNWVTSVEVQAYTTKASSILIQFITNTGHPEAMLSLTKEATSIFPDATTMSIASDGQIMGGQIFNTGTVVSMMVFEEATLASFFVKNNELPFEQGQAIKEKLDSLDNVKGLMTFCTVESMNAPLFFKGLHNDKVHNYTVFGGAAWLPEDANIKAYLILNGELTHKGGLVIAFMGENLELNANFYMGTKSLSNKMVVTDAENTVGAINGESVHYLKEIDNKPAFEVLDQYYKLASYDEMNDFRHEFPLLVYRDKRIVPREVAAQIDGKYLNLLGDIEKGDVISFGYNSPYLLNKGFDERILEIQQYEPDTTFIIGCIGRKFVLKEESQLEVAPLGTVSPTVGVYTGGEYFGFDDKIEIFNFSHITVALKELNLDSSSKLKNSLPEFPYGVTDAETLKDSYTASITRLLNFVDNAALVQAETRKSLQIMEKQIVMSEKQASLGRLVAGVAHEINTPLGLAVTYNSFMQDKLKSLMVNYKAGIFKKSDFESFCGLLEESLNDSEYNLQRAVNLVQSFKQVAVDQTSEQLRTIDICSYLESSITSLKNQWKNTKHTVSLEYDEDITVNSYPGWIIQILSNLIQNSLIHAFKDIESGHITIKFQRDGENKFQLIYQDNGSGMDDKTLKLIFDPFFTTNRGGGGSGLGMHIIYNIVTNKLEGKITADSSVDNGTTFTITMPLKITTENNINPHELTY